MNNYKIRINFSHHYTRHILVALKTTGADIEHDPNESIKIDLSDIEYEWKTTDL